jgi:hypothetical protein
MMALDTDAPRHIGPRVAIGLTAHGTLATGGPG